MVVEGKYITAFMSKKCINTRISYKFRPHHRFARFLMLIMGIFGFLVHAHYEASLTKSMTVPQPPRKIQSFRDVVEGGYRFELLVVRIKSKF